MSNLSNFTNLHPVMKTLRWELKPIGKTLENIQEDNGILQKDEYRAENYKLIKPILDKLHNEFINQSLGKSQINWSDFLVFYTEYKKKTQNKKSLTEKEFKELEVEFESLKKSLRNDIGNLYHLTAEERKIKYTDEKGKDILKENGYKILTEAGIQKVLESLYKDDAENLKIITSFTGFWTYFGGFNQNRENYYTTEGKSTEVALRIVHQNLTTFCNNVLLYDKVQEIGLNEEDKKFFDPKYYNNCLTQTGIDTYNYILGGNVDENVDGINQRINRHNQKHKTKIPQLTILYKQIGSLKKKKLFDSIETDEILQEKIYEYLSLCDEKIPQIQKIMSDFFENMTVFESIWISKSSLNWISNKFFANWSIIGEKGLELKIFDKKKDSNKERQVKIPEYVSFFDLKNILEQVKIEDQSQIEEEKRLYLFKKELEAKKSEDKNNWEYFLEVLQNYFENILDCEEENDLGLLQAQENLKQLYTLDKNNQEHKNVIKNFADKTIEVLRFLKLFRVDIGKWQEEISDFNKQIDVLIQDFDVSKYYDLIRNYLTKKPFSVEKMRLNFDCSTLLSGRDRNEEIQNLSVILKGENGYYLAIIKKDANKFFEEKNTRLYDTSGNIGIMQKMEYKLLPGPNKMLPKCLMPCKEPKKYGATDEILELYQKGTFKKGKDFKNEDMRQIIDFFKQGLRKYEDWQVFNFKFQDTKNYEDISKFYSEVEKQGYKLSRKNINKQELDKAVECGQIYLFQISSKDFNKQNKNSKPDLQTLYWLDMFKPGSNIKLSGGAEVFFRPASIEEKKQKVLKQANEKAVEHKRYTEDKILFHCPITLNFASQKITKFNDFTNNYLKNNEVNIIGIDRGEKHLNFYSVVNPKGEILEQGTLNIFTNEYKDKDGIMQTKNLDYGELLEQNAQNRLQARQNRETIGKIKELKEGYISRVVKKISELVLKYNAVVILEDLNGGFKNSRKKIEKSVYQNLEIALAKKLSFLVDKTKKEGENGSVNNPYQLCPDFKDFGKAILDEKGWKQKQRGIMFYTRANYTSTTDPITGRRKTIYLKKCNLEDMKRGILENFGTIGFDENKKSYFVKYGKRIIRSDIERRRGSKNNHGQRESKKYYPTEDFDKLFEKYGIIKNENILEQIKNKTDLTSSFYQSLLWIIELIMQIRNYDDNGNDFILSCVEDQTGTKFDSREYYKQTDQEKTNSISKPTSGDANGAYNIARKGILMLGKVKKSEKNLFVSDTEWDEFSQK